MRHPIYTAIAATLLALLAVAEVRGWTPMRPDEVQNVPRSIRDNPGAYRPLYIYRGTGTYMRGK